MEMYQIWGCFFEDSWQPIPEDAKRDREFNRRAFELYNWVFPRIKVPKMDGLSWKTLLKWMIWGYHYFLETPNST